MSRYSELIKEAKKGRDKGGEETSKPESKKSGKPKNQKTRKPEKKIIEDPAVNLSIKVGKSRRQHWAAEAKRQGTSLTAVITEALSKKFGEPE